MRHRDSHRDSGFQCISLWTTTHSQGEPKIPNTEYQPGTPCRARSAPIFFHGSVPWVPPGAAAGSACHSCCEAAAGSITPGVAAYERTGHRRPPGPHRDPASAARKLPEYSPNTSRRPPAGHHPNTSRILPGGRPKIHANTSRIPREYFPGTFRVTSGLYAIPLVANYSRSIRAVFG